MSQNSDRLTLGKHTMLQQHESKFISLGEIKDISSPSSKCHKNDSKFRLPDET